MEQLFLGIGANSGDIRATVGHALQLLERLLGSLQRSSLYRSRALYVIDQPNFLNLVVSAWATMSARRLLWETGIIERRLGRNRHRERRFGPRRIDIDILLYGARCIQLPYLTIPHPRLCERRFCLLPLLELEPALRNPCGREMFADCLPAVATQQITKLNE